MTTVLVPHTRLDPRTVRRLDAHAPGYRLAPLDPADMTAYWRLLRDAWAEPGDLVIVEHDIGIHASVLPGFERCPMPWCGHPYAIGEQMLVCLGCTRFTAALKAAEPDLIEVMGRIDNDGLPARDWRRNDVRLADVLHARGYEVHRHKRPVQHYHAY